MESPPLKFFLNPRSSISLGIFSARQMLIDLTSSQSSNKKLFVLSDPQIYSLWKPLFDGLPPPILIPAGEQYKCWHSVQKISKLLLRNKADRTSQLLVIGGGVLCDLGGFTASCYMRGISFFLIPTTLLAMVDAAIGGKTAINASFGKNLWGSFSFPSQVIVDPTFLQTLPIEYLFQGAAEMMKHALLTDRNDVLSLERLLLTNCKKILPSDWMPHIKQSCMTKLSFVSGDETEVSDRRILLNLGHTLAHALETGTQYQMSHGNAVFWGLLFSAYLSTIFCGLTQESWHLIQRIISPRLIPWPTVPTQTLCSLMMADKKSIDGQIRWVLLQDIGHPQIYHLTCQQIQLSLSDFTTKIAPTL